MSLAQAYTIVKDQHGLLARVPLISMLSSTTDVPTWFAADTSPSEWNILQRTVAFGESPHGNAPSTANARIIPRRQYPLAMIACGIALQDDGKDDESVATVEDSMSDSSRGDCMTNKATAVNKGNAANALLFLLALAVVVYFDSTRTQAPTLPESNGRLLETDRMIGLGNRGAATLAKPRIVTLPKARKISVRRKPKATNGASTKGAVTTPQQSGALTLSPDERAFQLAFLALVKQHSQ